MNIPKNIPSKYIPRIWFWDDERNIGNSIIITLKDGWCCGTEQGLHTIAGDSIKEAITALKDTAICNCKDCVK